MNGPGSGRKAEPAVDSGDIARGARLPGHVVVLCDLIADLAVHIPAFPVAAADLKRISYLALGPGGACNAAIMAAHLGLGVACLGEVGPDPFGDAVREGLAAEGIDVSGVVVSPDGRTPVAQVLVDAASEPAYLGYPGDLRLRSLPVGWAGRVRAASAVYADGWAEHAGIAAIVVAALRAARAAGVPAFFDPGPGNPAVDNAWHHDAVASATVVLANDEEAGRLTGLADPQAAGRALVDRGPRLAVVKRGVAGCVLVSPQGVEVAGGYAVPVVDATGAGDSVAGAVIYGALRGLGLASLGVLANATGAAKVQKRGTGRSMPSRAEVVAVLRQFGEDPALAGG